MTTAGEPSVFLAEQPRLLGLAYRILGSRVDAEDVVQDAWLRWSAADPATIDRPAAWLTTVTARLALDRLKSAHHRRETYVGPWLAEPIVTGPGPEETAERAETLTLAFLFLLDALDPLSRVVFLLTDVFGVPSREVAETVGKTPAACRQIAARARRKLRAAQPRPADRPHRELADRLFAAIANGDSETAVSLLAPDVVLVSDGGPRRHAARRPVVGPGRVTRFLINVAKRFPPGLQVEAVSVNSTPGLLLLDPDGDQDAAVALDVAGGLVTAIWVVTNPDKLTRLERPIAIT